MPHWLSCSNRETTDEPVQVRRREHSFHRGHWLLQCRDVCPRFRRSRGAVTLKKMQATWLPVSLCATPPRLRTLHAFACGASEVSRTRITVLSVLASVSLCGPAPTSGTAQQSMVIRGVPLEGGAHGSVARRYPIRDKRFPMVIKQASRANASPEQPARRTQHVRRSTIMISIFSRAQRTANFRG